LTIDPETVFSVLSSTDIKLITLTVTEKGYCYDSDNHKLDLNHPAIINDLDFKELPCSVIGVLAKTLLTRFNTTKAPVTIMSCDNVPENGNMLRNCLYEFISIKYPQILDWVKENINFPNTMVDRITPATSSQDIKELEDKYNIRDICGVHCEDFKTWVIEDIKINEVQMFKEVGALVVDSVLPYELMKIRLLNGAHSALSYPSYLLGHRDVDEGIIDPLIKDFIRNHYMREITRSLNPVKGVDLEKYKDQLIDRFSNKYIKDKLLRLASDGSKKITNAIVKPLLEVSDNNALILSLAFWAIFLKGVDSDGNPIVIEDPNADLLQEKIKDDTAFMNYLGITDSSIINKFSSFRSRIEKEGVELTLKEFLS
jgi:mannitol-1-phosphate/altronate dehydrogenase